MLRYTLLPGSGQRRHAGGRNHLKPADVEGRGIKQSRVMHSEAETEGGNLSLHSSRTPLLFPRRSRRWIREPASDWPDVAPSPRRHCGTPAAAKGLCQIGS